MILITPRYNVREKIVLLVRAESCVKMSVSRLVKKENIQVTLGRSLYLPCFILYLGFEFFCLMM